MRGLTLWFCGFMLIILGGTLVAPSARALTFGNPLVNGETPGDLAVGLLYLHTEAIPTQNGEISTWSFFDDDSNLSITPVLFQHAGQSFFTVRGIGATRTSTGMGIQTYDFAPQLGSGQISGGNFYFGWLDGAFSGGSTVSHNQGAIDFTSGGGVLVDWGDWHAHIPGIGQNYNFAAYTSAVRQYSFQVEVIPEPSTALLLGIGLAGMAARGRV